jgi:type I restriction-modification system DNA methylase subunit
MRELRALFVEKLDFRQTAGALPLPSLGETHLPPAQLIASRDGVQVVYVDALDDSVLTSDLLRRLYRTTTSSLGEIFLVCSTLNGGHWQFVYPRQQDGREVLRRLSVQEGQPRRTFVEQLAALASAMAEHGVRSALEALYDVEAVTNRFFKEYKRAFDIVLASIEGFTDPDERRLFCQTLFNRLMFLYFLQRKGCLKFNGRTDYLNALWQAHTAENDSDFYSTKLDLLFFTALANDRHADYDLVRPVYETLIGSVPFLNGGLFAKDALDSRTGIRVPNAAFKSIFEDLFDRFNFTITESTPYDVEVAVDPEMLGKVFEELVTGRHESGSYYTPRPIVAFMGHEALKGYLTHQVPGEEPSAIEAFVEEHDPAGLQDAEAILEALKRVRICDPACGSGAYLLGMLQELLALRTALFASRKLGARRVYQRKLEIIQDNLYGVDIDQFAVNIARLRLWLSLIVDFDGDVPPPLPNLDFKIECGDSLSAPSPEGPVEYAARDMVIRDFREAKARYAVAHGEEKAAERKEVERLEREVAIWTHPGQPHVDGVDWAVAFAEVFADGGFDIVLANPPYVRQEDIKDQKPRLKKLFPEVYNGTADLYCYFYARAIQLLKSGGILAFISSNKWFRSKYGTQLRTLVSGSCKVLEIVDFGELPVFEAAATFPMIFIARKGKAGQTTARFTQVTSLKAPYPDIRALVEQSGYPLPTGAIRGETWILANAATTRFLQTLTDRGVPLKTYVGERIYYGLKTGANEPYKLTGSQRAAMLKQDPKSAEVIKPLAVGDDVRRWHIRQTDSWLIVLPIGTDLVRYPAVYEHLAQERFRTALEHRGDRGPQWWELRACTYYHLFDQPKIIFPDFAMEPRATLDEAGHYTLNTTYFIPTDDLFLLGVLNSSAMWRYVGARLAVFGDVEGGGRLRFFTWLVQELPIPHAVKADRERIALLVRLCLDARGNGPMVKEWEAEMNEIVARLYGVSEEGPHSL